MFQDDPREDLERSLRQGLTSQVWPVADRYHLDGDLIKLSGGTRYLYLPMARAKLPFELATVEDGDREAALAFVRKRGLLGFNRLVAPEERVDGEPLRFIWAEAKNVRDLIDSIHQLERSDLEEDPDDVERALTRVQLSLSNRLVGVHPSLEVRDAEEQTGTPLSRLRRSFGWIALQQVVYWHIWNLIEGGRPLVVCQECGNFFVQLDARQRFCPPSDEDRREVRAGSRSRAQSRCALRSRQKRLRQPQGR